MGILEYVIFFGILVISASLSYRRGYITAHKEMAVNDMMLYEELKKSLMTDKDKINSEIEKEIEKMVEEAKEEVNHG